MNIDSILKPYERFGVHLGLERTKILLHYLDNPHQKVPIIHVAGSNGKGSTCAYLSSILTVAGYQVGRYTSPHLIDWTERICFNEKPIPLDELQQLLLQVEAATQFQEETPTQFEVITAAAWLYFAQKNVDIAIIEVGLGGRLDATNVCDHPLVSVITSISREHWQTLGPTLADIAKEKAGILKAGCPAVIGQLPPEAATVVQQRIRELDCPAVFPEAAVPVQATGAQNQQQWVEAQGIQYPLPLLGDIQLSNSALAIAALHILRQGGWDITDAAIQQGMAQASWPGRMQWTTWHHRPILIDGAHNPDAAAALGRYVDQEIRGNQTEAVSPSPVTWVMGMLSTKDHGDIFKALLRPGDTLYLVPVPDHSTADPQQLAALAQTICPDLANCQVFAHLEMALKAAIIDSNLIILSGSLYLLGHFLKLQKIQ